jgi:hypothetical protein
MASGICSTVCISLQHAEKPSTTTVLDDQEAFGRGATLAVSEAHAPAEITLHAAGTSRPSKARLRIACRSMPHREMLACTVAST